MAIALETGIIISQPLHWECSQMSKEHQFSLTIVQMEAVVKALENSGINSGDTQTMLACYGNWDHIKAAKSIRGVFRGKSQKAMSRAVLSASDEIRAIQKPDAIEELRQETRSLRNEVRQQHGLRKVACDHLEIAKSHLEAGRYKEAERVITDGIYESRPEPDELDWLLRPPSCR